jgi:imidazolonepropionase-like amidohydrolase
MHVHIETQVPQSIIQLSQSKTADIAFTSSVYARKTLMAGFTTIRDLGGVGVNISLRDAINEGKVIGPRIFTAGNILSSTGGHGDFTNGTKKESYGILGPKDGIVDSPDDARKAVRQRYKNGADWIKITATGGVLDISKSDANPQFTNEEIYTITKTASDYGLKVAAHAHGDEGMYRAVANGVKTIEHGTLIKERTMDLMISKEAYLVPTISAGKFVAKMAETPNFFHPLIEEKARKIGPQIQNTFNRAYKYGVPILFGTDSGVSPHGENAKEFIYMNEAGMPINESLHIATFVNAKILDMENLLGQIAPGFYADIVATDKNAKDDINTLTNVSFVMKNGKVYKK